MKTLKQLVAEKEIAFDEKFAHIYFGKSVGGERQVVDDSHLETIKSFLSTSLREIAEAAIAAVMVEKKDITKYISTRLTEESEMLIAAECTGFNSAIAESHSHAEEFLKG